MTEALEMIQNNPITHYRKLYRSKLRIDRDSIEVTKIVKLLRAMLFNSSAVNTNYVATYLFRAAFS